MTIKPRTALFIGIVIAFGLTSLFSYNKARSVERNNLESNLSEMIQMQKRGDIKYIDFSIIATFSWDQVYILGPYVIFEKVPLENSWPYSFPTSIEYSDGFYLLIFANKGKAVQYIEYTGCSFSEAHNIQPYDRNDALFIVDDKKGCIPVR
jgi:hypothetical protein